MKLLRLQLGEPKIVRVDKRSRMLTIVFSGMVVENLLEENRISSDNPVDVVFPARAGGARPSEMLLRRVADPGEFWSIVASKLLSCKTTGAATLADPGAPLEEMLRNAATVGDVELMLQKKLSALSGREILVMADVARDLAGSVTLSVRKAYAVGPGKRAKAVRGDLDVIRKVVYEVAGERGYSVSSSVESPLTAIYVLEKEIGGMTHRIHLELPLRGGEKAYRIWADVNGVRTYPAEPYRVMVFGRESMAQYAKVLHTPGYAEQLRARLYEATDTVEQQVEHYRFFIRPATIEDVEKVLSQLPREAARLLRRAALSWLAGGGLTWAQLLSYADAHLADADYALLAHAVIGEVRSGVSEQAEPQRVKVGS